MKQRADIAFYEQMRDSQLRFRDLAISPVTKAQHERNAQHAHEMIVWLKKKAEKEP